MTTTAKNTQPKAQTPKVDATPPETPEAAPEAETTEAAPEAKRSGPAVPADVAKAAVKRAAAAKEGPNTEAARMIAALQQERKGYVSRGLAERVTEVDKSIAAWKKLDK